MSDCECSDNGGLCSSLGSKLRCMFKRQVALRLIFVVAFAIFLVDWLKTWTNTIVNPLITSLFSHRSLANHCIALTWGQSSANCRDYGECYQRQQMWANTLTCDQMTAMGANVLHYGNFITILTQIFWLYVAYRLLMCLWCRKKGLSSCCDSRSCSPGPRRHRSSSSSSSGSKKKSTSNSGSQSQAKKSSKKKGAQVNDQHPNWIDPNGSTILQPDFTGGDNNSNVDDDKQSTTTDTQSSPSE